METLFRHQSAGVCKERVPFQSYRLYSEWLRYQLYLICVRKNCQVLKWAKWSSALLSHYGLVQRFEDIVDFSPVHALTWRTNILFYTHLSLGLIVLIKSGIIGGAETGIFRPVEHVWEEVNIRWMLGSGLSQLLSWLNNKDDNVSHFNFTWSQIQSVLRCELHTVKSNPVQWI